ncbi:MAG: zinc ribbon domain-containing protein [Clostridiales bacterium]|nr:zinc ribbon domain-containing protein [Clostridiales bacterium]
MNCETCGAVLEDGASFCPECGSAVGGNKTICKECGYAFDGDFCPICGAAADGALAAEESAEEEVAVKSGSSNSLMKMLGKVFAFAGAALALILMFFIGTRMVEVEFGMKVKVPMAKNIFWYFGDNFKELSKYLDYADMNAGYIDAGEMLAAIFSRLFSFFVALVTLVLVIVFGIIAIIKFIKSFSQENDTVKASIKVMLVYVLGATLLSALSLYSYKGGMSEEAITLNGATIFGLIFCTIAIVGAFVCKLLDGASSFNTGKILGIACAVVSFVVLLIAAHTGLSFKANGYWGEMKYNMSAFSAMADTANDGAAIVLMFAQFMLLVAVIFFVLSLFRNVGNLVNDKQNSCLPWAIICLIFSTIAVIFLATAGKTMVAESGGSAKADLLRPILLIVFSIANLVVTIVSKSINAKKSN